MELEEKQLKIAESKLNLKIEERKMEKEKMQFEKEKFEFECQMKMNEQDSSELSYVMEHGTYVKSLA